MGYDLAYIIANPYQFELVDVWEEDETGLLSIGEKPFSRAVTHAGYIIKLKEQE